MDIYSNWDSQSTCPVLSGEDTLVGLATEPARNALQMANVELDDIDLVLMCTSSPECSSAINCVAIAEALEISPSVLTAGLAADNVLCAVYFTTLFAIASRVPPEAEASTGESVMDMSGSGDKLPVLQSAIAIAVSFLICKAGNFLTKYYGIQGGMLPAITAIAVLLATLLPKQFNQIAPSGEVMAVILMQIAGGGLHNVLIIGADALSCFVDRANLHIFWWSI